MEGEPPGGKGGENSHRGLGKERTKGTGRLGSDLVGVVPIESRLFYDLFRVLTYLITKVWVPELEVVRGGDGMSETPNGNRKGGQKVSSVELRKEERGSKGGVVWRSVTRA